MKVKFISQLSLIIAISFLLFSCILPQHYGDTEEDDSCNTCPTDYFNTDIDTVLYDYYEPDDTTGDAHDIVFDLIESHTIDSEGDIDYYRAYFLEGRRYRINLSDISGFEPELTVYETGSSLIYEMKNTGTYTGTYDWWGYDSDRDFVEEERESIIVTASQSGYYYFSVNDVYDAHENGSYDIVVSELLGTSDSLTALPNSVNVSIDLTWGLVSGVEGYTIYRTDVAQVSGSPDYTDFTLLTTITDASTDTYSDESVVPGTTYYYYVKGFNTLETGEPGPVASSVVNISVDTVMSLEASADFEAVEIDLSWTALTNVDGYYIYRTDVTQDVGAPVYDDFTRIADVTDGSAGAYSDGDIAIDTTYYYYIVGYKSTVRGAGSNVAFSSLDIVVGTVGTLTAEPNPEDFQIDLSWTAIDGVEGYKIYKTDLTQDVANPEFNDFSLTATVTGATSNNYIDNDIEPNTDYYYYITAYTDLKEGEPGNTTNAMFDWVVFKPTSSIIRASEGYTGKIKIIFERKYDNTSIVRYDVYRSTTEHVEDIEVTPVCSFTNADALGTAFDDTNIDYTNPAIQVVNGSETGYRYYYYVKIIINIAGTEVASQYSWFDSGIAVQG